MDRKNVMSDALLRQRRNVIAISVFIPVYLFSGMNLYQVSFFGNVVLIDNPSSIFVILTVLYLYFLLRYSQFYREDYVATGISISIYRNYENKVSAILVEKTNCLLRDCIFEYESFDEHLVEVISPLGYDYDRDKLISVDGPLPVINIFKSSKYTARVKIREVPADGVWSENIEDQRKIIAGSLMNSNIWVAATEDGDKFSAHIYVPSYVFHFSRFANWLSHAFKTTKVTDYHLPFAISALSALSVFLHFVLDIGSNVVPHACEFVMSMESRHG